MYDNNLLRKAQLVMLNALKELDAICQKNDIKYWIDAGTLLGAVRHKGFIPWDDDIDICMSRSDYNKLVELSRTYFNDSYEFHFSMDDPYCANINIPCKFRAKGTEIIESSEVKYDIYNKKSPHGLFVDIFPYDKYSKNKIFRVAVERFVSYLYRCKVFTKYKNLEPIKKIASIFGFIIPRQGLSYLVEKQTHAMEKRIACVYGAGIETPFSRAYFEYDEIFPVQRIEFEGVMVNCPNQHLVYLTKMFGKQFMNLPPEDKRVSHYHSISLSKETK